MNIKTDSVPVLCYHGVSDGFESQWVLTENEFKNHIIELASSGFMFCSLDDIIVGRIDFTKKNCAITFDDGRIISDNSLLLMDKYQISATFFISTNFIDGNDIPKEEQYCPFFSWEQIEGLINKNHTIGSHTVSHPNLYKLASQEVLYEMKESKSMLEEKLGIECNHFAAPYGNVDEEILSCTLSCGYKTISNTDFQLNSIPFSGNTISRILVNKGQELKIQIPQIFNEN